MTGVLSTRDPVRRKTAVPPLPKRPSDMRRHRAERPILTPRQIECMRWGAEGKSSADIAAILHISPATVDEHIADACRRLDVRTRIQAVLQAYKMGFID